MMPQTWHDARLCPPICAAFHVGKDAQGRVKIQPFVRRPCPPYDRSTASAMNRGSANAALWTSGVQYLVANEPAAR